MYCISEFTASTNHFSLQTRFTLNLYSDSKLLRSILSYESLFGTRPSQVCQVVQCKVCYCQLWLLLSVLTVSKQPESRQFLFSVSGFLTVQTRKEINQWLYSFIICLGLTYIHQVRKACGSPQGEYICTLYWQLWTLLAWFCLATQTGIDS